MWTVFSLSWKQFAASARARKWVDKTVKSIIISLTEIMKSSKHIIISIVTQDDHIFIEFE